MILAVEDVWKIIVAVFISFQLLTTNSCECSSWNLYGKPGDGYYIAAAIGFPQQPFNLLIDTGSSNLAIAGASYPGVELYYLPNNSKTFEYQYNASSVKVMYTQGWWEGFLGRDFIQIVSLDYVEATLTDISIITKTHGFYVNNSHWQGILGLAYSEIAKPQGRVISWLDSISEQFPNIINHRFDLALCGPNKYPSHGSHIGKFSLGDFKSVCPKTKHTAQLQHRWYYEVLITGMKVGDKTIELPCSDFNTPKTIVDSGTSNLQLSLRSYENVIYHLRWQVGELVSNLTNEFWNGKKEVCFSSSGKMWSYFPILTISLSHDEFTHFGIQLPPRAYLRPALNRTDKECWLLGIEKGEIGTVLGTVALEGFCLSFDRRKGLISFSKSSCGPPVSLTPLQNKTNAAGSPCRYVVRVVNGPLIASSVILMLVLIPLLLAFVRWVWMKLVKPKMQSGLPFISLDETNPT